MAHYHRSTYNARLWSKLQSSIYSLMDPKAKMQIHCNSYRIGIGLPVPRYWLTIEKDIVWDFPKHYLDNGGDYVITNSDGSPYYVFWDGTHDISRMLRDYVNTPSDELLTKQFDDRFHLVPILLACDRRIGKRRMQSMLDTTDNPVVKRIIALRLTP